jgi:hypothetical protein
VTFLTHALKLAAALGAAWVLSGCGAMRIAYENADTFVRWRASSYVELQGEASDELDERIDAFHAWHRANELPQYVKFANEAAKRIEGGVSPQDIEWGYDSFMARVRESLREAAERIAPMLDRLTPEQIKHIEERFSEDNRKFARENMRGSEQDRRKLRFRRTRERLEDWMGRLSEPQLERVRQYAHRAPLFDELRDRDRKRLQAEFLATVRAKEAQKRLAEVALDYAKGRDPAYAAASDTFRKEYLAMLAELDKTLAPEQRARLAARFRGLAEDFSALARSAP